MLLVVTGDIQTGKTNWLLSSVARLEAAGVAVEGVTAPGVWRPVRAGDPGFAQARAALPGGTGAGAGDGEEVRYEKLGIDNVLLPGHERIAFARRADLVPAAQACGMENASARLGLVWRVDDAAVARVNAHFDALAARIRSASGTVRAAAAERPRRVLVVDELGRLELMHGGGLTRAMALLASGPQGWYDHALVIARTSFNLAERTAELYGVAWGGACAVVPGEEAWERWLAPLAAGGAVDGAAGGR